MYASAKIRRVLTAGFAFLCLTISALADCHYDPLQALNGQYSISASSTRLGADSFRFAYDIKNNNQGNGPPAGLDVFELLVPISATIVNVSNPLPYSGNPGYWAFSERASTEPGFKTLYWYGAYEQAVYPAGATMHLSFQANGVAVGSAAEKLTTYKYGTATDWYYAPFSAMTIGPVGVPEPSTFVLLGAGLAGAAAVAWRKRKHDESVNE
jgi:hypothetical protein